MIGTALVLAAALLSPPARPEEPAPDAARPRSRVVVQGETDVGELRTRIRFTTVVILPRGQRILDFAVGDSEYWVVEGAENFAYVKPSKRSARTNLNLITASGRVFTFLLREISEEGGDPDLKVFVRDAEGRAPEPVRFVPVEEAERERRRAVAAEESAARAVKKAQAETRGEVDRFRSTYPWTLRFPYRIRGDAGRFGVRAIFHDGRFTYLRADAGEPPALYEIKDGKPAQVAFEYRDGLYVVPKVIASGYLAVGKRRLRFDSEGGR